MGLWSNITDKDFNEARSSKGGVYFVPGNYVVKVHRCKAIETRAKAEAFVAECEVLQSDNAELAVGSRPSFYVEKNPLYPSLFLGNIADFVRAGMASMAAAFGEEPKDPDTFELTTQIGEAVTGEENLLAGVVLKVYAYNKPTKGGNPFTRFEWAVPENVAELAA